MPRLTVINQRPSVFSLSDPSGYTNFTALVPGNSERSFSIDGQVALAIESKLKLARAVGDIEFSLENDLANTADNSKRAVMYASITDSGAVIPPEIDTVLMWHPTATLNDPVDGATTPVGPSYVITLPPPGRIRDGHAIQIRDAIGVANRVPVTVVGGMYRLRGTIDFSLYVVEGDIIRLENDSRVVLRDGDYRAFSTGFHAGSNYVDLLDQLPGVAGSGNVALTILDRNGRIKFGPAVFNLENYAPYLINNSLSPYSIGNTPFCGVDLVHQPTLGFWSAVKLVG